MADSSTGRRDLPAAGSTKAEGQPLPVKVVVVDDEELARVLLRELLAAHDDVEIIAECGNGFEAVKAVAERKPDLHRERRFGRALFPTPRPAVPVQTA